MGTSISQPSPSGFKDAGQKWKAVKNSIKDGENPPKLILAIGLAFTEQYGEFFIPVLDKGVESVILAIKNADLSEKIGPNQALKFISDTRRTLAIEGKNSFFAELALICAAKSILKHTESLQSLFVKEYCKKVIDYILSRDLPSTIGSKGLTNLYSLDTTLYSVNKYIDSIVDGTLVVDPEVIIKSIFSPLKGSK